ncbi:LolA-related protein [Coralloluteibacterium thermophilus]|uniref:LolA-related protein n=1 Tax=Coralloluteibacterium thermophilum TaxID=2707049 RepID=A0ABV9NEY0_9GAMM
MRPLLPILLLALLAPAPWTRAAPDADAAALDALLADLARPPPSAVDFVEVRESALLDAPVRSTGRLEQPDADTLVRDVRTPQRERTVIRDGRVEMEREGRRVRRFSLDRAPELRGLLASFRGMLGGDSTLLTEHYRTALETADDGRWSLSLAPRDPRLAQHVRQIVLQGPKGDVACMHIEQTESGGSLTLLGRAAERAADIDDMDALRALCGGE